MDSCEVVKPSPFIKVLLKETDDMLLFESNSFTVLRDADDANLIEQDNKRYDFLTIGKGKQRKTSNAESQTIDALYKTRSINTDRIRQMDAGTFVSNYDMFDTYVDLERDTKTLDVDLVDKHARLDITTYSLDGAVDLSEMLRLVCLHFEIAVILTLTSTGQASRSNCHR